MVVFVGVVVLGLVGLLKEVVLVDLARDVELGVLEATRRPASPFAALADLKLDEEDGK